MVDGLESAFPSHLRFWGVIEDNGTFMIRGTCRSCGSFGEFRTQNGADEFKAKHADQFNSCPEAKNVIW